MTDTPRMENELPTSVWQGTLRLFGVDVRCHVLSDGQRVIEEDSARELIDAMANGEDEAGAVEEFARFLRGLNNLSAPPKNA